MLEEESLETRMQGESMVEENLESTLEDESMLEEENFEHRDIFADDMEEDSQSEDENHGGLTDDSVCDDELLYPGANVTLNATLLLLLTFATRHSLSDIALSQLLSIIAAILPNGHIFISSLRKVKKYFSCVKYSSVKYYYCSFCEYFNSESGEKCINCEHDIGIMDYFITLPMEEQLKSILSTGLEEIQTYRTNREKKNVENIEDVLDGKIYKERFEGLFYRGASEEEKRNEIHLSLQKNTDGVQLFRSSNFSVWPIYFTINEVPPRLRFTRLFRIFTALWFGKAKPSMAIYMHWVSNQLQSLHQTGVNIVYKGKDLVAKAILLSGIYDAPARCSVQNFIQFNGNFGCGTCFEKGESARNFKGNSVHVYPFNVDFPDRGYNHVRTHQETVEASLEAEMMGKPVMGCKGVSFLTACPGLDIIRGIAVDYMHTVCLGVTSLMLKLWTSKEYKQKPWYIGMHVEELDKKLQQMTPPSCVGRLPNTLTEPGKWKASEYKMFLLFYAAPLLNEVLPDNYFNHLVCLVQAMHVLLSDSISRQSLSTAKDLLVTFTAQFSVLYDDSFLTMNVHSLLHLCNKVEDLGPLWAQSAFFYEDLNKDLRNLFHGTQNVHSQILEAVSIHQNLPAIAGDLAPHSRELELYLEMTSHHKIKSQVTNVTNTICSIGDPRPCTIENPLKAKLEAQFGCQFTAESFDRILLHGQVVHSSTHHRTTRRNSYTVSFMKDNCINYGQVKVYLKIQSNNGTHYVAIVNEFNTNNDYNLSVPCFRVAQQTVIDTVVDLDDLKDLCFFMEVQKSGSLDKHTFIAHFPNFIERE